MEMTIDKFIKRLQLISKEKRKLPLIIYAPNGIPTNPRIKMQFKDFGSPLSGDELEKMVITWK